MNALRFGLALLALATACLALPAPQQPVWPGFRGPLGNNIVDASEHPTSWGEEKNIAWSAAVPGGGWSSPVVVGDRVIVTTAVLGDQRPSGFRRGVMSPATRGRGAKAPSEPIDFRVLCFDLSSGKKRWDVSVGKHQPAFGVHPSNTFATESPATDGERVYVTYGGLGAVIALDLDGKELWRHKTGVFPTSNDFGWASSLLVDDGRVFVQSDNEKESFLMALDARSGKKLWHRPRKKGTCWASPILWRRSERTEVVALGSGRATGYAPATGEVVWSLEGISGSFSSSPTIAEGRLVFGNAGPGRRGPLLSVTKEIEGVHTLPRRQAPPKELVDWKVERAGPGFPSPLVIGGHIYVIGSMGVVNCHEASTGKRVARERLPGSSTVVASPWTDGKSLFILDEEGRTFVLVPGKDLAVTRVNEVKGLFWATPAIAGDRLLLREARKLICVRTTKP